MRIRVRRQTLKGAALALLAGVPISLALFGFTVDDALISIRVAQHLATGSGYRFNSGGPVVDAVTPLGWAHVLTLLYREDPWEMLLSARVFGLLAWWVALVLLGRRVAGVGETWRRWLPLLPLAVSAPLAVWSSSGMETGVVTLLAVLALSEQRSALWFAGLAAAWRPELLGWALVLGLGRGWGANAGFNESGVGRFGLALGRVAGPFIAVAFVRVLIFGQAAPLSAIAKPTDLQQGLFYAAHAFVWTGFPVLLFTRQLQGLSPELRAIAVAGVSHFGFVGLVGGDWMALYRLVVPVLPGLVLVAAALLDKARAWSVSIRLVFACALNTVLLVQLGPSSRRIAEQRAFLSEQAEPFLNFGGTVGTLDVGWVGAATQGTVFDFAGVTDPAVARLCCGHHAKKIDHHLLEVRGVDTLVLLLAPGKNMQTPWWQSEFARFSENYVARQLKEDVWLPVAELPLKYTDQKYVILRRSVTRFAALP